MSWRAKKTGGEFLGELGSSFRGSPFLALAGSAPGAHRFAAHTPYTRLACKVATAISHRASEFSGPDCGLVDLTLRLATVNNWKDAFSFVSYFCSRSVLRAW